METGKPIRMAVASDQAIFRRGLSSLVMSLKGIQLVGEARDGGEAIQLCELAEPDIFLLDFRAPLEEGKKIAGEIHKRWPHIKTILMASTQEETQVWRDLDEGLTFYFSRDISEEEFVSAVQRIGAEGRKSVSEPAPGADREELHQLLAFEPRTETSAGLDLAQATGAHSNRELLSQELVMAGKIQASILPDKTPAIPGWDISAKLVSARETSGDFYDFIPFANGSWGFVIADVSEKGMGAALFMALSSTLIRTFAARFSTLPSLTLEVVNERILSDTHGDMFVTAIYGVLDPHIGRIRFVNAGHPPAYLISTQKGKPVDRLRRTGMALGVMENAHWEQKIVKLTRGDVLLFYTDGVTEAQNPRGVYFGEQRLLELIRSKSTCSAEEIQETILTDVENFVGSEHQQDDIALIVICRKG